MLAVQIPFCSLIEETARDLAGNGDCRSLIELRSVKLRGYQFGQKMKPAYNCTSFIVISPFINPQSGLFRLFVTDRLYISRRKR